MMLIYAKMVVYVVMMALKGATNAFVYLDSMVITVRYVSTIPKAIQGVLIKVFRDILYTTFLLKLHYKFTSRSLW